MKVASDEWQPMAGVMTTGAAHATATQAGTLVHLVAWVGDLRVELFLRPDLAERVADELVAAARAARVYTPGKGAREDGRD